MEQLEFDFEPWPAQEGDALVAAAEVTRACIRQRNRAATLKALGIVRALLHDLGIKMRGKL